MKTSYYNLRTDIEDNTLVFNTISKSFVCFSRRRFDVINHKGNFIIEQLSDDEVLTLLENGFIIENNDLDERQIWLDLRQQRRLKNDTYMMIINPTLDCNLKCWYCFQNHKKGSHITDRLIEAICTIKQESVKTMSKYLLFLFHKKHTKTARSVAIDKH